METSLAIQTHILQAVAVASKPTANAYPKAKMDRLQPPEHTETEAKSTATGSLHLLGPAID